MKANESVILNVQRLNRLTELESSPGSANEEPASVCDLVVEAVRQTCSGKGLKTMVPAGTDSSHGPHLLRVLTYSYAKGVLSAEEIERKCAASDPTGDLNRDTLRRFRRLNRTLVQTVLERTLRLVRRRPAPAGSPSPASPATSCPGTVSSPETVLIAREAAARLDEAAFIDAMSMD